MKISKKADKLNFIASIKKLENNLSNNKFSIRKKIIIKNTVYIVLKPINSSKEIIVRVYKFSKSTKVLTEKVSLRKRFDNNTVLENFLKPLLIGKENEQTCSI